jgi:ribonuclease HI
MELVAYTDGSLKKQKNKTLCGYGVFFPNGEIENKSKKFIRSPITNNRAELYAILTALKLSHNYNIKTKINKLSLYSDSEYAVKTITVWYFNWIKNGKDYKNNDIIDEIMRIIKKCKFEIVIKHINSHTGLKNTHSSNNDKADELAKNGALLLLKQNSALPKRDKSRL